MVDATVYGDIHQDVMLECSECVPFWYKCYDFTTLRKINDDWNDHLKEFHNAS